jgi:hypothetical protein
MTEQHDYKAEVVGYGVRWVDNDGDPASWALSSREGAEHFAATLNRPDLTAEVERLRGWKASAITVISEWEDVWVALGKPGPLGASKAANTLAEVERLTAERDRLVISARESQAVAQRHREALARHLTPDPEAPPIPCVEVDPTDGRRTWEAPGRVVRELGDEWERRILGGPDVSSRDEWPWDQAPHNATILGFVYLIRRTTPPAPRTVTVELPEDVAHRFGHDENVGSPQPTQDDRRLLHEACKAATSDPDGTVEVLTEDGDR